METVVSETETSFCYGLCTGAQVCGKACCHGWRYRAYDQAQNDPHYEPRVGAVSAVIVLAVVSDTGWVLDGMSTG